MEIIKAYNFDASYPFEFIKEFSPLGLASKTKKSEKRQLSEHAEYRVAARTAISHAKPTNLMREA